jgi:hypothetical protein
VPADRPAIDWFDVSDPTEPLNPLAGVPELAVAKSLKEFAFATEYRHLPKTDRDPVPLFS